MFLVGVQRELPIFTGSTQRNVQNSGTKRLEDVSMTSYVLASWERLKDISKKSGVPKIFWILCCLANFPRKLNRGMTNFAFHQSDAFSSTKFLHRGMENHGIDIVQAIVAYLDTANSCRDTVACNLLNYLHVSPFPPTQGVLEEALILELFNIQLYLDIPFAFNPDPFISVC